LNQLKDGDLSVLKRLLFKSFKSKNRKQEENGGEDTNQSEPDSDSQHNENNQAMLGNNNFGEGIMVPIGNNMKVNICDQKYISWAEQSHKTIKDTLVAACSGSTGNFNILITTNDFNNHIIILLIIF
jgi:hypothetical protein